MLISEFDREAGALLGAMRDTRMRLTSVRDAVCFAPEDCAKGPAGPECSDVIAPPLENRMADFFREAERYIFEMQAEVEAMHKTLVPRGDKLGVMVCDEGGIGTEPNPSWRNKETQSARAHLDQWPMPNAGAAR